MVGFGGTVLGIPFKIELQNEGLGAGGYAKGIEGVAAADDFIGVSKKVAVAVGQERIGGVGDFAAVA